MFHLIYGENVDYHCIARVLLNLGSSYQSKGGFQRAITFN